MRLSTVFLAACFAVSAVAPASAQRLRIQTTSLPPATVGISYSAALEASGGDRPYRWSVHSGSLPDGLSLNAANGRITGTPERAGSFTFDVRVRDDDDDSARATLTLVVGPAPAPLAIATDSLPPGLLGQKYAAALTATGGTGKHDWSIASGSLPDGLNLKRADGLIEGAPKKAGSFSFTVRVEDGAGRTATKALGITVSTALSVATSSLAQGTVGTAYSQTLAAEGGLPPYAWAITDALPAGLTLAGATITGTPAAAGNSSFTARVTDAAQNTATRQLSISIGAPALQIVTASLPQGTVGVPYSHALTASGGTPPYTWTVNGALPAGLTLSGATISGTPTTAGTSTFTVLAGDGQGVASRQLSILIGAPALLILTESLPQATVGAPYSHALAASGGTPPYAWAVNGALPAGLTLSGATIGGTPTTAGTSTFTLQVSDGQAAASRQFAIVVGASALQVATASLAPATVGVPYFQPLAASGGTPPYTWAIVGSAPSGIAIFGPSVTGVPSAPGIAALTLRVSDARGNSATREFTLTVQPAALAIVTAALPQATVGVLYSQPLAASGGTPPYAWTAGGNLPPGLELANGTITGAPAMPGNFNFTLRVSDAAAQTASRSYTLSVGGVLSIVAQSLADGSVGTPYSQAVTATGGTPPYSWAVVSGALPDGLALDPATGVLGGVPAAAGSYTFAIRARDAAGVEASRPYTVEMSAGLVIATAPVLPQGASGGPYSQALTAAGGRSPYIWSITAGALPAGLTLHPATGLISGTPSASGQFEFTVLVNDSASARATKAFALSIAAPLLVSSAPNLPDGSAGHDYSHQLSAAGGAPPFVWSIQTGALPAGLRLDPATGILSGTPVTAGAFEFTALVTDSLGAPAAKQFHLRILPGLAITSGLLAGATVGSAYTQPLSAVGGTPPYTWSLAAGALPAGLTLAPETGVIAGTPSTSGSFVLILRVADAAGLATVREHVLSVGLPPLPSVAVLGGADVLDPMQQPAIGIALAAPYPAQITGQIVLSFEPDAAVPGDDPAVQFATGGRVAAFTIPANAGAASFAIPGMAFQTGTVAGLVTLAVTLRSGADDITPPGGVARTMRIPRSEPKFRAASAVRTDSGFEVRITGLSPGRELARAAVRLTASPGSDLQTAEIPVPLAEPAARWYADPAARQFGSQFTLILPFTVQGSLNSIETVTVTLANEIGISEPAVLKISP